jgi:hypothetical protein
MEQNKGKNKKKKQKKLAENSSSSRLLPSSSTQPLHDAQHDKLVPLLSVGAQPSISSSLLSSRSPSSPHFLSATIGRVRKRRRVTNHKKDRKETDGPARRRGLAAGRGRPGVPANYGSHFS